MLEVVALSLRLQEWTRSLSAALVRASADVNACGGTHLGDGVAPATGLTKEHAETLLRPVGCQNVPSKRVATIARPS
jgi:hypothetical protein